MTDSTRVKKSVKQRDDPNEGKIPSKQSNKTTNMTKHEKAPITKTRQLKYIENFTTKQWKFSDKKIWYFFHISGQNIDCGEARQF